MAVKVQKNSTTQRNRKKKIAKDMLSSSFSINEEERTKDACSSSLSSIIICPKWIRSLLVWKHIASAPQWSDAGLSDNLFSKTLAVEISLVLLASRFERIRMLFWTGPLNFELRTDDKDDTRAGIPLSKLPHETNGKLGSGGLCCTTLTGGRLAPRCDLTCNRPHTRRIFGGIEFRSWNTPTTKPRPYH
ncbi:hypothetical protein AVEN_58185-1 [Araneus ventricosus]|uniref:Uncharacterized protein n=1 Tax=Araneus ventricosus TaxID=182803 RepID=A0A4Y2K837_ARAVE|nr:hypothetical protein AVEN_58185-1 [Araneus ventricosus]